MNNNEREALYALRFDVAPTPDDVWRTSPFHVDSLHRQIALQVMEGLEQARKSPDSSPIGIAIQGEAGSGKTHMLGWVRGRTQVQGGYFFLVGLLDEGSFWSSVAHAMFDGLQRQHTSGLTQLRFFLSNVCKLAAVPQDIQVALAGKTQLERKHVDAFANALRDFNPAVGLECQNTARALVLLGSTDYAAQDIGMAYLQSTEEMDAGERAVWGIRAESKPAQVIVYEISRLLALTGPTVMAVDQVDTLIAQSTARTTGEAVGAESPEQLLLVNKIADGLMALRQTTRRTLTVLACLPHTWILLRDHSTKTVADRFQATTRLSSMMDAPTGRELVEKRFAVRFKEIDFIPPYPSWPIRPETFNEPIYLTPRRLIKIVNDHVRSCLDGNAVRELTQLVSGQTVTTARHEVVVSTGQKRQLDERFQELRSRAGVSGALDSLTEDTEMPALLIAGLQAWVAELGERGRVFSVDPPPSSRPALHARLRRILDESVEDEQHWSFRAVASEGAIAALNRIRNARTVAGLSRGIGKRKLILLRNLDWAKGPKTQLEIKTFAEDGGATLRISEEDLKTFAALKQLMFERDPGLQAWLQEKRPAGGTTLLKTVLGEVVAQLEQTATPRPERSESLFGLELETLRKHTAIFAGSGSGKTVLIRRLIEECALQGVSSIVLDPNNDLARLGDPWPQEPGGWLDGDAVKAKEYLDSTDVVVWTPRREAGRPLSFRPLPDFQSVLGDVDEFNLAVDAAVAALAPRAKVDGDTAKASQGRAVLREALVYFGQRGLDRLSSFTRLLAELPDGVSTLDKASKLAADMAQTLAAAMVNDPLFGGEGTPLDAGVLLTPPAGKRARVSVISFVGLPSDDQRQSFVNQLQMALFAWIKRHPAGDRPLGGLLVMDEAQTLAPSGPMTPCTQSTLALASQARKYGLGLVFATQAPKGLHNRIPGNAATQFFGLLNAPVQIDAAREMARAKGADVPDIARLRTGEFYLSGESSAFQRVNAPLCLTHHPKSPLTTEEVLERARLGF